jgi:hypothetical protein
MQYCFQELRNVQEKRGKKFSNSFSELIQSYKKLKLTTDFTDFCTKN